MAIEVGRQAPDFTLKDPLGEDVSLSSFRGRNVVLVFYPAAFSDVCTAQFAQIADGEERYAAGDAQVIGISVDSRHSQERFAQELGLTDTILLADFHPKGAVARDYGVWIDDYGVAGRATFVIDSDGVVRSAHLTDTPLEIPAEEDYFRSLATCAR